jgi:hypothetical protein
MLEISLAARILWVFAFSIFLVGAFIEHRVSVVIKGFSKPNPKQYCLALIS